MDILYLRYIYFCIFIVLATLIDLYIFNNEKISGRSGHIFGTIFWVMLALLFSGGIFFYLGYQKWLEYITGYVVELSLSTDNIFIFMLLFSTFSVPKDGQRIILSLGILGAIIFRLIMITAGIYFINKFKFLFIIFGSVLLYSGFKIITGQESSIKSESIIRIIGKFIPLTDRFYDNKMLIRLNNKLFATPLLLVLLLIEKTDLIFALDSIPAILSITQDPFIVFSSNIFAIIGLRSLYFFVSDLMSKLHYLKYALAFILSFIGLKMILVFFEIYIPILLSLIVIICTLSIAILFSYNKNVANSK